MKFDLPAMARRKGIRRAVTFRPINPTQAQAQALAQLYLAVVKAWDPDRILARYSPDLTSDSASDDAQAIEQTASDVRRLIVEFGAAVRRWAVRAEIVHRGKWAAAVFASTAIDLSMFLTAGPVQEALETFVERNVALVKDVSEQARGRISDAVFRGYQQRRPVRDVAKEIREATGMARDRSIRIAGHQNSNLSAAFDRERRAEAGLTMFRYRHGGKKNFRPWHKARDRKVYDSKTGKQVNPDGSAMTGGDTIAADDRPGVPPGCGCREQAYLPIMDEIGV